MSFSSALLPPPLPLAREQQLPIETSEQPLEGVSSEAFALDHGADFAAVAF